jgi:putative oxidoreductase
MGESLERVLPPTVATGGGLPLVTSLYEIALFLLRVVTGFIVWQHGAQKLFGMFGGVQADVFTPAAIAGAAEFVGGIALAAGFITRPVALILAVDMAVLYVTQFLPEGFPPILIRAAEVTCLLFCVTLLLAFTGPGRASVDGAISAAGSSGRRGGLREHLPAALGVVRVLMGLLFFSYGLRKMFGLLEGEPEPFLSLQWFAGVIELFGGAAIVAGLFTGPVAFLCSGEMAFAYFINHNPRGFFPIQNGGERAALFSFFFLFLFAAGPGKWSVDGLRRPARKGG